MLFMDVAVIIQVSLTLAQAPANTQDSPGSRLVVWAIILLGIAAALFFVEIFVPSGGLLGTLSAVCVVGGVVMLFQVNTTMGLIGAAAALLLLPFALASMLKIWPNTPIGRALTLRAPPSSRGVDQADQQLGGEDQNRNLVGQTGQAITDLHPVGMCLINGQREQCLAQDGVIDAGSTIQIVSAEPMQIKVKQVE